MPDLEARLAAGERRFKAIEVKLDSVLAGLAETKLASEESRDLIKAWSDAKAFGRVMVGFGKLLAWLAAGVSALGILLLAAKAGLAHWKGLP